MEFGDLNRILEEAKSAVDMAPEKAAAAIGNAETTGQASADTCSQVLQEIAKSAGESKDMKPFEVFFCVSCLLQGGATSPKTPGATKFIYGNATVTVDAIRKACRDNKVTVRQFARGLSDQIAELMLRLGDSAPQGNLARAMKLELKNISQEEAVWASDFQTYNSNCPSRVRNWLVKNFRARFRKN